MSNIFNIDKYMYMISPKQKYYYYYCYHHHHHHHHHHNHYSYYYYSYYLYKILTSVYYCKQQIIMTGLKLKFMLNSCVGDHKKGKSTGTPYWAVENMTQYHCL
jgi:hypothetical protein